LEDVFLTLTNGFDTPDPRAAAGSLT
jgi:hypothetical protein